MFQWFIALKYLTARFITFAALLTVASGVALLIVIMSVMEGFRTDLEDRIRGTSADIRVESKGFIGLRNPPVVKERIDKVSGILSATPYVETLVMCRPAGQTEFNYLFLQGLDLIQEGKVGALDRYLEAARDRGRKAGRLDTDLTLLARQPVKVSELLSPEWLEKELWNTSGETRPEGPIVPVLIGLEAMQNFHLPLGRSLKLTSYSPVVNRAVSGEFVVAGVFLSRDYLQDSRTVLMPVEAAANFLELGTTISGFRVTVAPGADLEAVAGRLKEALVDVPAAVRVRTWREEKASLLRAVRIEKTVVGIILGMLIVFAGFMIFIVLTVQVVEKTRDLGILQSLGSTSWGIARIYLLIGSGVCILGTFLGAFLGIGFSLSLNTLQRWLYLLVGFEVFPKNVYYIDHIPVRLAPIDLLYVIAPTVAASLLASVIPAYRAARKDPVVALRYE
jgi:lipoprotein-releasing system permease protein